jgi:hypothetical protein
MQTSRHAIAIPTIRHFTQLGRPANASCSCSTYSLQNVGNSTEACSIKQRSTHGCASIRWTCPRSQGVALVRLSYSQKKRELNLENSILHLVLLCFQNVANAICTTCAISTLAFGIVSLLARWAGSIHPNVVLHAQESPLVNAEKSLERDDSDSDTSTVEDSSSVEAESGSATRPRPVSSASYDSTTSTTPSTILPAFEADVSPPLYSSVPPSPTDEVCILVDVRLGQALPVTTFTLDPSASTLRVQRFVQLGDQVPHEDDIYSLYDRSPMVVELIQAVIDRMREAGSLR